MTLSALVFDAYGTLFDVHSVVARCNVIWPGRGAELSALWRSKQLEYSWLRSLMGRYADFGTVTTEALHYATKSLGLPCGEPETAALMAAYRSLHAFPDARPTLENLSSLGRAILSNGEPGMLADAVQNAGLEGLLDAVLSVDPLKIYKPHPDVYRLATAHFALAAGQIGFVTSNAWDAAGAKAFGFRVFWINRLQAPFDSLGVQPDHVIGSLAELPGLLSAGA